MTRALPLRIQRHARARHIILRLSPDGRELLVTLPSRITEKRALAFVKSHTKWIAEQRAKHQPLRRVAFLPDTTIPLFGKPCLLVHDAEKKGTRFTGRRLIVGGPLHGFQDRVKAWIIAEAKERFGEVARHYAANIRSQVVSVTLRDTRSRWGSCSHSGRLSFSWRLALAPAAVADYVIAHEVAHLKHFDHSPAFWRTVAVLQSDWEKSRDWLQREGKTLHQWG